MQLWTNKHVRNKQWMTKLKIPRSNLHPTSMFIICDIGATSTYNLPHKVCNVTPTMHEVGEQQMERGRLWAQEAKTHQKEKGKQKNSQNYDMQVECLLDCTRSRWTIAGRHEIKRLWLWSQKPSSFKHDNVHGESMHVRRWRLSVTHKAIKRSTIDLRKKLVACARS